MEVSRDKYLLVVFLVVWCAVTGATGHPAVFFSPDPICASDWVDHLHPFDPLAPRDQSGKAHTDNFFFFHRSYFAVIRMIGNVVVN